MTKRKIKPRNLGAWTTQDHKRAVTLYKTTGSIQKTSDISGIPYGTLERWMRADWWKEMLLVAKSEDSTVLEDAATSIAKEASVVVRERIANGDYVFNKDGVLVRRPVGARDASIVMGIALSKRKELQESPVRENQLGTSERLLKLVEQFARFANAQEIKGILAETREDQNQHTHDVLETQYAIEQKLQTELSAGISGREHPEEGATTPAEHRTEGDDPIRESTA